MVKKNLLFIFLFLIFVSLVSTSTFSYTYGFPGDIVRPLNDSSEPVLKVFPNKGYSPLKVSVECKVPKNSGLLGQFFNEYIFYPDRTVSYSLKTPLSREYNEKNVFLYTTSTYLYFSKSYYSSHKNIVGSFFEDGKPVSIELIGFLNKSGLSAIIKVNEESRVVKDKQFFIIDGKRTYAEFFNVTSLNGSKTIALRLFFDVKNKNLFGIDDTDVKIEETSDSIVLKEYSTFKSPITAVKFKCAAYSPAKRRVINKYSKVKIMSKENTDDNNRNDSNNFVLKVSPKEGYAPLKVHYECKGPSSVNSASVFIKDTRGKSPYYYIDPQYGSVAFSYHLGWSYVPGETVKFVPANTFSNFNKDVSVKVVSYNSFDNSIILNVNGKFKTVKEKRFYTIGGIKLYVEKISFVDKKVYLELLVNAKPVNFYITKYPYKSYSLIGDYIFENPSYYSTTCYLSSSAGLKKFQKFISVKKREVSHNNSNNVKLPVLDVSVNKDKLNFFCAGKDVNPYVYPSKLNYDSYVKIVKDFSDERHVVYTLGNNDIFRPYNKFVSLSTLSPEVYFPGKDFENGKSVRIKLLRVYTDNGKLKADLDINGRVISVKNDAGYSYSYLPHTFDVYNLSNNGGVGRISLLYDIPFIDFKAVAGHDYKGVKVDSYIVSFNLKESSNITVYCYGYTVDNSKSYVKKTIQYKKDNDGDDVPSNNKLTFKVSPKEGYAPLRVGFYCKGSGIINKGVPHYVIHFGDDSFDANYVPGTTVYHTYNNPGSYNAYCYYSDIEQQFKKFKVINVKRNNNYQKGYFFNKYPYDYFLRKSFFNNYSSIAPISFSYNGGSGVHLTAYIDFQSPYSKKWYVETLRPLLNYSLHGKKLVKINIVPSVLDFEKDDFDRAKAVHCAARQGYAAPFFDAFFDNLKEDTSLYWYKKYVVEKNNLKDFDFDKFSNCFNDETVNSELELYSKEYINREDSYGLPTFKFEKVLFEGPVEHPKISILKTEHLTGAQPFDNFKKIVEKLYGEDLNDSLPSVPDVPLKNVSVFFKVYPKTGVVPFNVNYDCRGINGVSPYSYIVKVEKNNNFVSSFLKPSGSFEVLSEGKYTFTCSVLDKNGNVAKSYAFVYAEGKSDEDKINDTVVSNCTSGCELDGKCIPFGQRVELDGENKYCAFNGNFELQKSLGDSCQNDYECKSNQCYNSVCSDIQEELQKTQSLMEKILSWFKKIGLF